MDNKNENKEPGKPEEPKPQDGKLTDEEMDKVSGGLHKPTHFNPQPDPPLG